MLTLTTLGGLALDAAGGPLGAAAGQRRPLALLAVLAASGDAGLSRDKLTGILWSESEPERARHALTQALYSLRRATGCDALVLGTADLRLNPAVVRSDVAAFEEAIRAGRSAEAVELYRGPFLDGVYVAGAAEFERWATAQRDRLARRCAGALEELARMAEGEGDFARAAEWRRRLVALDPLDSAAALALIEALSAAGDVSGALRCARIHEVMLREQLELPLPPAIGARLAQLQQQLEHAPPPPPAEAAGAAPGVDLARTVPAASPPESDASPAVEEVRSAPSAPGAAGDRPSVAVPAPSASGTPGASALRGRRERRWRMAATFAMVAALGAVVASRFRHPTPTVAAAPARADVIAVLPFRVSVADPSAAYLGEGLADLMARILTGEAGPRSADQGAVLAAVERLPGAATADAHRANARRVGAAVGAAEVVVGEIGGTPEHLRLTAAIVDVATGAERTRATVEGPPDQVPSMLDALTGRLLAGRQIDGDRLASFANIALPALRAFLRAETAYRADRYEDAARLYELALDYDSTFAPAALGLAVAADQFNSAEQHDRGLALAWAARDALSERDRAYLVAFAGPHYPAPSTASEHLEAWERAVRLSPDRAEAWDELGERLLYDGTVLGLRTPGERAGAAFRRALEIDPGYAPAVHHLLQLAAREGDSATLRALAVPSRRDTTADGLADFLDWRVAIARGDAAVLAQVRGRFPALSPPSLRAIAMAAQYDGVGLSDADRALRLRAARAALGAEQLDVLLARHSLALNQGRPVLALDVTEQLEDAQPGSRAHLRLRVLDALYSEGDSTAAVAAARELAAPADAPAPSSPQARATYLADVCVLTQWRIARRELGTAPRAIAALAAEGVPRDPAPVGAAPRACAAILQAMLAVATRRPDARAHVARLDSLMLTGPAMSDARSYANLVVARLYDALGDRPRALAAVRRRAYMKGWPRYLSTSLREEGRLAVAAGDWAGAVRAYRQHLTLRSDPEPILAADVVAARAALDAALGRRQRP